MLAQLASDERLVTSLLINVCAVMEKVDEQLLPSVYAYVGATMDATASQLGLLTFSRALLQALASPFGGYMGHYYNRVWVVTAGCLLWAAMTAAFSTCNSVAQGSIFWAVNGIGLSLVIPNSQSLIADYWSEQSRGRAFGMLQLMSNLGGMLGVLWGTNVAAASPLGTEGWRVAFLGVAIVSLVIGCINAAFSREPRLPEAEKRHLRVRHMHDQGFLAGLVDLKRIVLLPSFLIIILQGVVGSFPWVSLAWGTLYLQLIGMSPLAASACYSLFQGGGALGSLIGGALGDWASKKSPRHGRVAVAQISVGAGVPMMFLVLKVFPANGSPMAVALYASMFTVMGLTITWCAPACNNPMFAEIVPSSKRTLIYAFDRSFEGAIAAMGAPLVGMMAEFYGFRGNTAITDDVATNMAKAVPLGNALLVCTCLPWLLCTIFYTGLHITYWRDKEAAQREPEGIQLTVYRRVGSRDDLHHTVGGSTGSSDDDGDDAAHDAGLRSPGQDMHTAWRPTGWSDHAGGKMRGIRSMKSDRPGRGRDREGRRDSLPRSPQGGAGVEKWAEGKADMGKGGSGPDSSSDEGQQLQQRVEEQQHRWRQRSGPQVADPPAGPAARNVHTLNQRAPTGAP